MTVKKSRPRGRPALAPAAKKRRNFTFRGTDQLHERLSTSVETSGRSLSEEIEWRLEKSFEADERLALLRQEMSERIEDFRKRYREELEAVKKQSRDAAEDARRQLESLQAAMREMDAVYGKAEAAAELLDVLMGKNEASSGVLRQIALELAADPNWSVSPAGREAMLSRLKRVDFYEELIGKFQRKLL